MEQHELNSIPENRQIPPDAEDAERRKREALAQMDLLIMQKHAANEETHKRYRSRARISLEQFQSRSQPRKPSSRVDLAELMQQYKVSPEALERFEMQHISNVKGVVRPALFARIMGLCSPFMLMFVSWTAANFWQIQVSFGLYLVLALLLLPVIYYFNVWKLEYDFASGMVQYHSLFHGTHYMNMRDMLCYSVSNEPDMPFPFWLFCRLDPRKYLTIRTAEVTINIPLELTADLLGPQPLLAGFSGAEDFRQCLERYSARDLQAHSDTETAPSVSLKKEPEPQTAPVFPALSEEPQPAPVTLEKTPQTKPVIMPALPKDPKPASVKPVKAPEPVSAATGTPQVQPLPERPAMPERSDAFPDPTGGSFPDPAQKPKPDADALFAQVLRDYGKL